MNKHSSRSSIIERSLSPNDEEGMTTWFVYIWDCLLMLDSLPTPFLKFPKFGQHFPLSINYKFKSEMWGKGVQPRGGPRLFLDSWPIKHTVGFAVRFCTRCVKTPGSIFPKSCPCFTSGQNGNIFWLTLITFWPKSRKILTTLVVLESYEPGTIQTWSIGLETKSISFLGHTDQSSWKSGQLN